MVMQAVRDRLAKPTIDRILTEAEQKIKELATSDSARAQMLDIFQERLAELELQLEDSGWQKLAGGSERDFSRDGLRTINKLARLYFLKNPLIKRAVLTQAQYVFSQGVNIQAEHPLVNELIQSFIDDPHNKKELTEQQTRMTKEIELQCFGNLFFAFFINKRNGRVRVRSIPCDEIDEIITNPEDSKEPWYYKRTWTQTTWGDQGAPVGKTLTRLYPDWRYHPTGGIPARVYGFEVDTAPVYHVAVNKLSDMTFGVSEIYAGIDWARAYKEFLENWATIVKSYARFAWQLTLPEKGGIANVAAAKAKLGTTRSSGNAETNPAPVTGSTFISTQGVKVDPIKTAGAQTSAEDGRHLRLMVSSATGIFEHYLTGDPSCYSADTEVLTEHGFMRHDKWRPGTKVGCYNPATEELEFREPYGLRAFDYTGKMVHFNHSQTDILVTPNHRMWVAPNSNWKRLPAIGDEAKGKSGRPRIADGGREMLDQSWRIQEARTLADRVVGWKFKAAPFGIFSTADDQVDSPIGRVKATSWARFLGYWLSEGNALSPTKRNGETRATRGMYRVQITQNEGPILDKMIATVKELGITYNVQCKNGKAAQIVMSSKALWSYLRNECGTNSHEKHIPAMFFDLQRDARQELYNALMEGDGGYQGRGGCQRYSTISVRLADDVQRLALSLGYGATVKVEKRRKETETDICRVLVRKHWIESIVRPQNISEEDYSGKVYCFSLPYHLYFTRRNGKIAIQGNTGNLATAKAMELPMLIQFRCRQQLWTAIYLEMLAFVIDCSVKYGGPIKGKVSINDDGEEVITFAIDTDNKAPGLKGKPFNRTINVTFPDILERDITARVAAIVSAATLNGQPTAGTIEAKLLTRLLLEALGIDEVDTIIDAMFPPEGTEEDTPAAEVRETQFLDAIKVVKKLVEKLVDPKVVISA